MHPSANRNFFIGQSVFSDYKFVDKDESLYDSLHKAKIVAGHFSTALIESIAYRIPTISILWFSGIMSCSSLGFDDIGIVKDKLYFDTKVKYFLKKGWCQENTRDIFFPHKNKLAVDVIVSFLEEIIKNKSNNQCYIN